MIFRFGSVIHLGPAKEGLLMRLIIAIDGYSGRNSSRNLSSGPLRMAQPSFPDGDSGPGFLAIWVSTR